MEKIKIESIFGKEFADKLKKYSVKIYEPLNEGEIEELKKLVREEMDKDLLRMEWQSLDVVLAKTWAKATERIKLSEGTGNYYVPFFWRDLLLSGFAPKELADKMEDDTYYLVIGRGLKEREYQGQKSWNINMRDAIPCELELEEEAREKPVPVKEEGEVPVDLLDKVRTLSKLTKAEITPEYLRKSGIVEEGTSDETLKSVIEQLKKDRPPAERKVPGEIPIPPKLSPETQATINLIKTAQEILGKEGLTIQAIKELAKDQIRFSELTKIQDGLLQKYIDKVKSGAI